MAWTDEVIICRVCTPNFGLSSKALCHSLGFGEVSRLDRTGRAEGMLQPAMASRTLT